MRSSISFSLASYVRIENLTLTGSDSIDGTGNSNANVIIGNGGNNILQGGAGNDIMVGGGGGSLDMLDGGSGFDIVIVEGNSADARIFTVDGQVFVHNFMGTTNGLTSIEALRFDDGTFFFPSAITDTNGGVNKVAEGAADGTIVGITAHATHPMGGDIVYSLVEGNGAFAIDAKTGIVTVAHGELLDFEANETRTIVVRATAVGGVFSEKTFTIALQDVAGDGLSAIDLAELSNARGFAIAGNDDEFSGFSVSHAGDVNGDGFDDVVIGAWQAEIYDQNDVGKAYVIFGGAGAAEDIDLGALTPEQGFTVTGGLQEGGLGRSVSSAGDVNGDGFDDLILGAFSASPFDRMRAGESYIIYGKDEGPGDLDLAALTAAQGFRISGANEQDYSGQAVSAAGDINDDGIDDFSVATHTGISYVVYGQLGTAGDVDLASLEPSRGFTLTGADKISAAGDINGDGISDLILGAAGAAYAGQAYVIYGKHGGPGDLDLQTITAADGFKITGSTYGEGVGISVHTAGDVNGDGLGDLIVGATGLTVNGNVTGGAYVVYGKDGGSADIDLATLTPAQGFRIIGVANGDNAGYSVSIAGDVNGDGIDDLIIGANAADPGDRYNAGESYLVYGKQGGLSEVDLGALTSEQGFKLSGAIANDFSGLSVGGGGDINGDGFDDLIVGALYAGEGGQSYVIYGGDFTKSVANLGTEGDDTLTGGSGEAFVGGLGNDVLGDPFSDANAFHGGGGDDMILASMFGDPLLVDGGSGIDTFKADELSIDLTGNLRGRVQSIEILDLEGLASNMLTLDSSNVAHISGSNGSAFGPNTILIKGDGGFDGDIVALADSGWVIDGEATDPFGQTGVYTRWINGAATALIETDVQVLAIGDIDLADLSPAQGFTITGVALNDHAGTAVSTVGDINDDGIDDFIVGASGADPASGIDAGQSYVIYGKAGGLSDIDLSTLTASQGFKISGGGGRRYGGQLGERCRRRQWRRDRRSDRRRGRCRSARPPRRRRDLCHLWQDRRAGRHRPCRVDRGPRIRHRRHHRLQPQRQHRAVGRRRQWRRRRRHHPQRPLLALSKRNGRRAEAYVIYGKVGGLGDFDLRTLTAAQGFRLANQSTTHFVSGVGDLNGDGFDDVAVGAGAGSPGIGYVIFGQSGIPGTVDLGSLSGSDGFQIAPFDDFTESNGLVVSAAGDINGDGFEDLAVADAEQGPYSGRTAVIYGKAGGPGDIDLSALTLDQGFSVFGVGPYDASGRSISSAGDVNGDGIDDLLIGAPQADPGGREGAGEAYLIFGKAGGLGDINLATLTPDAGLKISGAGEDDATGASVRVAGDINGDGYADIIIGAPRFDAAGSGKAYVIYGGDLTGAVTHAGTAGDDTLTGSAADEVFIGGLGNDLLEGGGGKDAFHGGAGDDIIVLAPGEVVRVDGGNGIDTVAVSESGPALDFTAGLRDRFQSIEILNLDQFNVDHVTLDASSISHMTGLNGGAFGPNTLLIKGDGRTSSRSPTRGGSRAERSSIRSARKAPIPAGPTAP